MARTGRLPKRLAASAAQVVFSDSLLLLPPAERWVQSCRHGCVHNLPQQEARVVWARSRLMACVNVNVCNQFRILVEPRKVPFESRAVALAGEGSAKFFAANHQKNYRMTAVLRAVLRCVRRTR
ncbi:MAG: hypothetical protein AAF355_09060 [Myxococcota bacterium]